MEPSPSEIPFDPANPNAGPILNWKASPEDYAIAATVAARITGLMAQARARNGPNSQIPILDPQMVQADLIALHLNGRPQNLRAWLHADPVTAVEQYSLIYYQFDRRLAKLPDFVKLIFDAR